MIRKYAEIFCWKNVSRFCSAKATHIFSAKNIRILCIESAKTVNEMALNELVKLTTLWKTGSWLHCTEGAGWTESSQIPHAGRYIFWCCRYYDIDVFIVLFFVQYHAPVHSADMILETELWFFTASTVWIGKTVVVVHWSYHLVFTS